MQRRQYLKIVAARRQARQSAEPVLDRQATAQRFARQRARWQVRGQHLDQLRAIGAHPYIIQRAQRYYFRAEDALMRTGDQLARMEVRR